MAESTPPTCPDCRVPMERGHLLVVVAGGGTVSWCSGEPQRSWTGGIGNASKTTVESFRCPRCGLVRNYA